MTFLKLTKFNGFKQPVLERVPGNKFSYTLVVVQLLSHVQLCNSMDCSTSGFHVLLHLLELAQTHIH